ncbi:hypothetical protein ACO2Q8_22455 [Larkinella sp. VNQ87]|uniref:hypothetical protein n=1 Tax=Larkinella sp. VNQ87 TaxID=3400921 RepID=UPI003C08292D
MDLSDAIRDLPEYEPRADLWDRIEGDLRADGAIDRVLGDLPVYEPRSDAWESVAERLEKPVVRPLWVRSLRWAAAAVVLLVGGLWLVLKPASDEKVTIAYETEVVETELTVVPEAPVSSADRNVETFINEQCEQQVVICQKPEVKELKQQLDELNTRKATVEEELAVFGNDPALVQAQIKLENERAEVTKELVRLLMI